MDAPAPGTPVRRDRYGRPVARRRPVRPADVLRRGLVVAVVLLALAITLPRTVLPDAPVPASLAPHVEEVRSRLWGESLHLPWPPPHLQLVEARCGSSGAVALLFRQLEFPWVARRWAYGIRGSTPAGQPGEAWGGGTGVADPEDAELVAQLGGAWTACR